MKKRGDALALAVALSAGEEVTLGPSDSALCAEALQFYANARRRDRVMRAMRLPAMIVTTLIATLALGGSSAIVSRAKSEVASLELRTVPVGDFAAAVRRYVKPIAHVSPASLAAQSFTAAFEDDDS
ncbi:hypothetical protein [Bradyrhizobium sp. LeoA1S1]